MLVYILKMHIGVCIRPFIHLLPSNLWCKHISYVNSELCFFYFIFFYSGTMIQKRTGNKSSYKWSIYLFIFQVEWHIFVLVHKLLAQSLNPETWQHIFQWFRWKWKTTENSVRVCQLQQCAAVHCQKVIFLLDKQKYKTKDLRYITHNLIMYCMPYFQLISLWY